MTVATVGKQGLFLDMHHCIAGTRPGKHQHLHRDAQGRILDALQQPQHVFQTQEIYSMKTTRIH